MKKVLLAAILAAFAAAGCGGSSSNGGGNVPSTPSIPAVSNTPVNLSNPDTFAGSFKVGLITVRDITANEYASNNCAEAVASGIVPAGSPCVDIGFAGETSVTGSVASGSFRIANKLQSWMADPNEGSYLYLSYPALTPAAMQAAMTVDPATGVVTISPANIGIRGVGGRDEDSSISDKNATFVLTVTPDGKVSQTLDISLDGGMNSYAFTMVYEKVSDLQASLDPNTLLDPAHTPVGFNANMKAAGVYKVTFFGTSQSNGQCIDDEDGVNDCGGLTAIANLADALYVTNNCSFAKTNPDLIGVTINVPEFKNQCTAKGDDPADPDITTDVNMADSVIALLIDGAAVSVVTKSQLTNPIVASMAPNDQYQYMEYSPVSYNGGNALSGTGLEGYNYDAANKSPSAVAVRNENVQWTLTTSDDWKTITMKSDVPDKVIGESDGAKATVTAHVTMIAEKIEGDYIVPENMVTADFLLNPTNP